jgi:hypothetical protein
MVANDVVGKGTNQPIRALCKLQTDKRGDAKALGVLNKFHFASEDWRIEPGTWDNLSDYPDNRSELLTSIFRTIEFARQARHKAEASALHHCFETGLEYWDTSLESDVPMSHCRPTHQAGFAAGVEYLAQHDRICSMRIGNKE